MNRDQFIAEARSWFGTPFMPNGTVKGAGVSCQKLPALIYQATGIIPASVAIPNGPDDHARSQATSLMEPFIENDLKEWLRRVTAGGWQCGDLLGFDVGTIHHLGLCLGDTFVHVWRGHGVLESRVDDAAYLSRLKRIWRPSNVIWT